ncbi:MAG: hypothetical protein BA871_02770 [Desulfuromonadales bacterium C00003096]|nr:MAG: hypothetical protein BA871_02770 [Desulfuromonadales bacterium C00003096]
MLKLWQLSCLTFREGIRYRALHGVLILAMVLTALNFVLPDLFMYDLGKVAVDIGLSITALSGLLLIFFLAVQLFGQDLDKRTVYLVLACPVSRRQYILGKFLGTLLLLLISFVFLGGLTSGSVFIVRLLYPAYAGTQFSWMTFLMAQGFLFLGLVVTTAVAFFFASFTTSSYMTLMLTLLTYVIGHGMEPVKMAIKGKTLSSSPWLIHLIDAASWVFPNLAAFDFKTAAAYGLPLRPDILGWTVLYGLCYTAILLLASALIFARRELA